MTTDGRVRWGLRDAAAEDRYRRWRTPRQAPLVRIGMAAAFAGGVVLAIVGWLLDPRAASFLPSIVISTPGFVVTFALTWSRAATRWLEPAVVVATGVWGAAIVWGSHRFLDAPELGTTAVLLVILFGLLVFRLRPAPFLPVSVGLTAEHVALLLLGEGPVAGGTTFHVALTVALLVAGQIVGVVVDRTDRTQFRQEELIVERTAEVERLLRERTDFFTGLSHEFRTPLASILAYADMLRDDDPKPDGWHRRAGEVLHGCASQLLAVVNDILEIARERQGRREFVAEAVDPAELLRDLWPPVEALAERNGVTATLVVPDTLPSVVADTPRLREAVMDLVSNALKYTPGGGRIEVLATRDGGEVAIRVSDTGPGIPGDLAERVFEPFYRLTGVRPQRGQPSSGLGLALVRQIVSAHGGTVRVLPNVGEGAIFEVRLPTAGGPAPGGPRTGSGG